jgi:hypothetical protein
MNAKPYLVEHGVEEAIAAAVACVLRERPADPIEAIGRQLSSHHHGSTQNDEPFPLLPITSPETLRRCKALPLRKGDIFVASFPKSGTTWMQHIVHTLATDGSSRLPHVSDACPFFDVDRTWQTNGDGLAGPVQANHAKIGRRIFNTHLRWRMMPKDHPDARYVYLVRRPADACISFFHHLTHQSLDDGGFAGTLDEFVTEWAGGKAPFGSWSAHLRAWLGLGGGASDPRVLVVSYEEMKADLASCVRKVTHAHTQPTLPHFSASPLLSLAGGSLRAPCLTPSPLRPSLLPSPLLFLFLFARAGERPLRLRASAGPPRGARPSIQL